MELIAAARAGPGRSRRIGRIWGGACGGNNGLGGYGGRLGFFGDDEELVAEEAPGDGEL